MAARSAKSFYGKKTSYHRFMHVAVAQVLNDNPPSADIIMIGPPTGGNESNVEEKNEDDVGDTGMPQEVLSELIVQQRDDNNGAIDEQFAEDHEARLGDNDEELPSTSVQDQADENEETDFTIRKWREKQQSKQKKQPSRKRKTQQEEPQTKRGTSKTEQKGKKTKNVSVKWTKRHILQKPEPSSEPDRIAQALLFDDHPELAELTMWSAFELVFNDIVDLLMEQTTIYAIRDKNKPNFSVSKGEMSNFIGLIFLSGYNIHKSQYDYWSVSPDLRCDSFRETMSRNRFAEIKPFLHAADNNALQEDTRMAKLKPLYNILNEKLVQFGIVHDSLSVDKSMVPYFGCHSCKQFIKAKPIRFGFKIWMLASSTGMLYHTHL